MELAGDVTRQDIIDIIEGKLGAPFFSLASRLGCDVTVDTYDDLTPAIIVNTNDDHIRVRITTVDLYDESDEHVGWEFSVHIINAGLHQILGEDNADIEEPLRLFKKWADIAKLATDIAALEIYPGDYLD